jgi:tetratricopeptide (TPR) repeat protein
LRSDPRTRHNLALLLERLGQRDRALEQLDRAVADDPRYGPALVTRASFRLEAGDAAGAAADLEAALALDADDTDALYYRGVLRGQQHDDVGARADYDRIIELKPDTAEAYLNRGDLRRRTGDLDGALADLTKALALGPNDAVSAHLALGLTLHARGAPDELRRAIEELNVYLAAHPDNARILIERAQCHDALGEAALARADYQRCVDLHPADEAIVTISKQRLAVLPKE